MKINLRNIKMKKINVKRFVLSIWLNFIFIVLLILYVVKMFLRSLVNMKFTGKIFRIIGVAKLMDGVEKFMNWLDGGIKGRMSRIYLIELSFRNMKAKKNRAVVTIGGVAVGVGAIVFLVSIGYGLEKLVVSRVARLDELKMADINNGESLSLKLNDGVIEKITNTQGVDKVLPIVSMVSKVKYNNSVLDVMSFGVSQQYMKAINPTMLYGKEFEDRDLDYSFDKEQGEVKGVNHKEVLANFGEKVEKSIFNFNVFNKEMVMVYEEAKLGAIPLGYIVRDENGFVGEEIWGDKYFQDEEISAKSEYGDEEYSRWIRAKVPLWFIGDDNNAVPSLSEGGIQKWAVGFVKIDNTKLDYSNKTPLSYEGLDDYLGVGDVLGEATESASLVDTSEVASSSAVALLDVKVATDSSGVEWVELKSTGNDLSKVQQVPFAGLPAGQAYVTTGMLKMLGLGSEKAVGQKFTVSYIIPDSSIPGKTGRLQSNETEYVIAGVIDDTKSNAYYYNIADAKRLGVKNYSQIKVITKNQNVLPEIRKYIANLGYKTSSTVDTVNEINKIFKTLRLILGFLGTIALVVASLGMFNTMTVSLLERTREVGVMKAIGMLSDEVRELFLAESMIMGLGGGLFGILLGYMLGRVASLILSSISVVKGQGLINISYIPWFFISLIMLISFLVGIVTGWYPSRRARKISALNALRYE